MKKFLNWIIFLFTGKGKIADEAINEGLVDYSGQGRDERGNTTSGHGNRFDDLTGKTIGIWHVLEFDHTQRVGPNRSTLTHYKCQCCACGRIFVRSRSGLLRAKGVRHIGKCK